MMVRMEMEWREGMRVKKKLEVKELGGEVEGKDEMKRNE